MRKQKNSTLWKLHLFKSFSAVFVASLVHLEQQHAKLCISRNIGKEFLYWIQNFQTKAFNWNAVFNFGVVAKSC